MAELSPIAKRIYNVSPDPVSLTLDDGTTAVFHLESAEFFQREFQAEGTRDGDDARYRFVTASDDETVLVGRESDGGWTTVGRVVEAEPAGEE
ncbi:MAG: transcriptional regulator [Salinigranum sp.]